MADFGIPKQNILVFGSYQEQSEILSLKPKIVLKSIS